MATTDTMQTSVEQSEDPFHTPQTSEEESDEFYPFLCNPCSRRDLELGAEVYCIQCEEYFCERCLEDHNKFAKMMVHTMLDRMEMEEKGQQTVQPLLNVACVLHPGQMEEKGQQTVQPQLIVSCDIHPGQFSTAFCGMHDSVCCGVCVQDHHTSCSVSSIAEVAKSVIQSRKMDEFKLAMKKVETDMETVRNKRKLDMEKLTLERYTEINKIHKTVEKIMTDLEAMKTTSIDEVDKKYTEMKANIENDLTKLDKIANTFNTKLDQFDNATDAAEKFIHMKTCRSNEESTVKLIKDIETHSGEEKLVFQINMRAEESLKNLRSLGKLILEYLYSVTPESQHPVDTKNDTQTCNISDICVANDQTILITDWDNRCLKRLDKNNKVIDRLKLDDSPSSVCVVSVKQAAVAQYFSMKVQLVTMEIVGFVQLQVI